MSLPVPGDYFIVNGVPSVIDSSRLAITFNGQSAPLSVNPLVTSTPAQVWTISNYDQNTQTISPKADPSQQIAFGNGFLTTLPAGAYTWTIRGSNENYTFQDGGVTVYWDLGAASPFQEVTYESQAGNPTESWWLYRT